MHHVARIMTNIEIPIGVLLYCGDTFIMNGKEVTFGGVYSLNGDPGFMFDWSDDSDGLQVTQRTFCSVSAISKMRFISQGIRTIYEIRT